MASPQFLHSYDEMAIYARKLEAENAVLREVLGRFARLADNYENNEPSDWVGYRGSVYVSDIRAARDALKGGAS